MRPVDPRGCWLAAMPEPAIKLLKLALKELGTVQV
jgi:hypothetical protein